MKIIRPLIFLAALGGAMSALACDLPAEIDIPPGDEATLDEMVAAQAGVMEFMAAVDEYLTCKDAEIEALGEDATEEDRTARVEEYNSGVDLMEETAAEFNEQRQLFQDAAAAEEN